MKDKKNGKEKKMKKIRDSNSLFLSLFDSF